MQYVLLFPHGDPGWGIELEQLKDAPSKGDAGEASTPPKTRLSCKNFYTYRFQVRSDTEHMLKCGRLLQQYVFDMYVKVEDQRLQWIRHNQDNIHSALYQGLVDHLHASDNVAQSNQVGRRVVLPSSMTGSLRFMHQKYQDAMAIVRELSKPDFFVTFTSKQAWKEITVNLLPGQTAQDRPDLVCCVFNEKLKRVKAKNLKRSFFGKVAAMIDVIEFQKRGLPHCHMLIILKPEDKPKNPKDYEKYASAELPDEATHPEARATVLRNLVH